MFFFGIQCHNHNVPSDLNYSRVGSSVGGGGGGGMLDTVKTDVGGRDDLCRTYNYLFP